MLGLCGRIEPGGGGGAERIDCDGGGADLSVDAPFVPSDANAPDSDAGAGGAEPDDVDAGTAGMPAAGGGGGGADAVAPGGAGICDVRGGALITASKSARSAGFASGPASAADEGSATFSLSRLSFVSLSKMWVAS